MRVTNMAHWLKILLLGFVSLAVAGCDATFSDREGELVTHWIACQKSRGSEKWVALDKYNRFSVVHTSRYQVSFASQRVVSSTGLEFKKCTVYNRKNWTCDDFDGSRLMIEDGSKPMKCSKASGVCYTEVGRIFRAILLVRGVEAADSLCDSQSVAFKVHLELPP
jgi:hypothetical protein